MRKQRFGPAFLVIGIMLMLIGIYVCGVYLKLKPDDDKICRGIFIDTVDIGGMTREQAGSAVDEFINGLKQRALEVDVNGEAVTASLDEIGFECTANDYIDQALQKGKGGSFFENYAEIKKIEADGIVYHLEFTYSDKKLKKFVSKTCDKKRVKAKSSKIKMRAGKLVYTESRDGITIDEAGTIEGIKEALREQEDTDVVKVSAVITKEEPKLSKSEASRCKDKLGAFSTSFNASSIDRSKNVANAARLINGHVVYPGETFSVHDTISPLTEDNGYYAAPSYNNGQVVDSIGGGVCQVSTTLYNAVLRAELEIVERSPHSMLVSYVSPSMDAAIAGDYKDLKFKNNTDVPVYLEGGIDNGTVYFRVYGEETRPKKRTVTFESETVETIAPGADKVTYDASMPVSYVSVTQEAHQGCRAILWKIVKENGKEKKTQVNTSTYQAQPRYVTKGSAGTQASTPKPKPSQGETYDPGAGGANVPAATKKPAKQDPQPEEEEEEEEEPEPEEEQKTEENQTEGGESAE